MPLNMAKSLILKEAELVHNSSEFDELQIDFMGGEPLMNFDLIREIVEWLGANQLSVPFICFATTNGTLMDDEKMEWFRKYRNIIWLGLSYDGSEYLQQINRGVKAQIINFDYFHDVWPEQGFKLTIAKESLRSLAEVILDSQKKGYKIAASLAQGIDWSDDDAELYLEQLSLLSVAYLADNDLTPINILSRAFYEIDNPPEHQHRYCGSGVYMITYDIDGTNYGCHMFAPIVMGEESALEMSKIDWMCETIADDDRCKNCILKSYCPTCMGLNYHFRGEVSKRDFGSCKMILAEAIASCKFQIKVLTTRRDSLIKEDVSYGRAALVAYPLLSELSIRNSISPFVM